MDSKNTAPVYTGHTYFEENKISLQRLSPIPDTLHSHDFLELVYVMQGQALQQLGTSSFSVSAGDYFVIEFGSMHRYVENREFVIVNCLFRPEFVDRVLVNCPSLQALLSHEMRQFGLKNGLGDQVFRDESGRIRTLIEAMEREFEAKEAGYLEMVRCYLIEILVHTERIAEEKQSGRQHPAVAAMVEYAYEHCAEPLSLSDISARLGYTTQYLSSLFHKHMGMNFSAYLQQLRVEKSCRLLLETSLPVMEIAQLAGYHDQKHFNQVFRRYTGKSPREFRKQTMGIDTKRGE